MTDTKPDEQTRKRAEELLGRLVQYEDDPFGERRENISILAEAIHAGEIRGKKENQELLEKCELALNDWLNTYANEFCNKYRVAQAMARIKANGGTIAYIGRIAGAVNAALRSVKDERGGAARTRRDGGER